MRDRVTLVAAVVATVAALLLVTDSYGATGSASAFGPGLYGNRMACGGALTPSTRAVAHRYLPCGSRVRVCYWRRCTIARVRDRGPWVAGRTFDLSEAVVRSLGFAGAWSWGVRTVAWWRA